jgi:beta-phosphoglucomutase-like phosphatase (HAD superfamily)
MLGLPDHVTACLFDLDGVLTPTAEVHKAAWEDMFNTYLRQRSEHTGEPFVPFDPGPDYHTYVDGKARADGVRSFLGSRGITLPEGNPDDPGTAETVNGLGNRKNTVLLARLRERGVQPYPGSVSYLQAAQRAGLRRAVVSASANCREVVEAAGIADLLEVRVDGVTARTAPARQARARHLPRRRRAVRRGAQERRGLRGRARRRGGRSGRRVRVRGGCG